MTHAEAGQIREERVSPFVQSPENSPQHTREVSAEGAEHHGKLPSLLHQVCEQLEEGGQDPVVEASILSSHSQLSVSLQRTQSAEEPITTHVLPQRATNTQLLPAHKGCESKHRCSYAACLDTAGPQQQIQVLLQDAAEAAACSRGEARHASKLGVVAHRASTRGQQGGGVAQPLPPSWRHTHGQAIRKGLISEG